MKTPPLPPLFALVALLAVPACTTGRGAPAPGDVARQRRDSAEIHDAIVRGARAFERGDPAGVTERYAPDVVLAYPGIPDMDHAALTKGYGELRNRPATEQATTVPTFDEILVSGDLALVRVRWTTTIATPERTTTRRLKDFQVWRRGGDGRWTFARGMHYREPAPASASRPESLLARAVLWAGGREALERARALVWEGDAVVHAGGREVRIAGRWSVQPPDTAVVATYDVTRGPGSTRSMVLAAPRGWIVRGESTQAMPEAFLANERDAFYLYEGVRLVSLLAPEVRLESIAQDSLGQPGVRASRTGRPALELYFAADGRLAHFRAAVRDAGGGPSVVEDVWLTGEITADGVRWPRRLVFTQNGAPYFDLTLRAFATRARLDDPLLAGPR